MAKNSSIDIVLAKGTQGKWYPSEILQVLVSADWTTYAGHIPLGAKNTSSLTYAAEDFGTIIDIFEKKYALKEPNGVKLFWQDTHFGGLFIFWPGDRLETFTIEITENPKQVTLDNDYAIIDLHWYVMRLFPALNEAFGVACFEFKQTN